MAWNPVPNEFPNVTEILTLESLKSLAFLIGSRRFSEISQGNGYTHFWQTREDQQGAHRATMICKESGNGGNRKFLDLAEKPGVFSLYISTIHF